MVVHRNSLLSSLVLAKDVTIVLMGENAKFTDLLTNLGETIQRAQELLESRKPNKRALVEVLPLILKHERELETLRDQVIALADETKAARLLDMDTSDLVSNTLATSKRESNAMVIGALRKVKYPALLDAYRAGKVGPAALRNTGDALDELAKDIPEEELGAAIDEATEIAGQHVGARLAKELEKFVSSYPQARPRLERKIEAVQENRYVLLSPITGGWRLNGMLPQEAGELVADALGAMARIDRKTRQENGQEPLNEPARLADALVAICAEHERRRKAGIGERASRGNTTVTPSLGVRGSRRSPNNAGIDSPLAVADRRAEKAGAGSARSGAGAAGPGDTGRCCSGDSAKEAGTPGLYTTGVGATRPGTTGVTAIDEESPAAIDEDPAADRTAPSNAANGGSKTTSAVTDADLYARTPAEAARMIAEAQVGGNAQSAGNAPTIGIQLADYIPLFSYRTDGTARSEFDLGRSFRLASKELRELVLRRDHGCLVRRCDALPELCEIHHVIPWSEGGPTDLANLVALCPHHHWIADLAFKRFKIDGLFAGYAQPQRKKLRADNTEYREGELSADEPP